jgi:CheY-like chemotaxis protein
LVIDQPSEQDTSLSEWTIDLPQDLPVIGVSMPGSLRAAQSLGIENYMIKPVLREQLLEAIAKLDRPVHKVLIVDDDPQLVELVSRMLQSASRDYDSRAAFGGAEALAQLRREPVDLVLLDLMMPEVNGLMVLQTMKADSTLAQIPVIVISAQYPEAISTGAGLFLRLFRPQDASIIEILNCLRALTEAMPLRGLPPLAAEPASPAVPIARSAF